MERSVVITGATGGIGQASAFALARAGYRVIGTARNTDKAGILRERAERAGMTIETVLLDVTDERSCEDAFARIAARTDGGPWCVINNAGIAKAGAIEDIGDTDVRELIETNVIAPARISRLVLPTMRRRGTGRIINISSVGGRVSIPLNGWYSVSKHGLESLSDVLRVETARDGVQVVLIEPGAFATDIWEASAKSIPAGTESSYSDAYVHGRRLLASMKDLPGPERVARTIVRAVTARKPRPRYLVGTDAHLAARAEALLPTALMDWGKQVLVGLRAPRLTARLWRKAPTATER